jgi:hypothetical protein
LKVVLGVIADNLAEAVQEEGGLPTFLEILQELFRTLANL